MTTDEQSRTPNKQILDHAHRRSIQILLTISCMPTSTRTRRNSVNSEKLPHAVHTIAIYLLTTYYSGWGVNTNIQRCVIHRMDGWMDGWLVDEPRSLTKNNDILYLRTRSFIPFFHENCRNFEVFSKEPEWASGSS